MPPRPTACSWRGSPTNARRQSWVSASWIRVCRLWVPIIPASSTITVAPRPSWYSGDGSRSGRVCSHRSLATVSQRIRVSRSKTRAAFAVGATPSTGRSWVWRSATARSSIVVLPAPAGPTTTTRRSWPAIARAASAWHTSNPTTSTVVDGAGSASWASVAHTTIRSSSARICSVVRCGASGSTHTDRPSPRRVAVVVVCGSRLMPCSRTLSQARSSACAQRCPDICDTGGTRSQMVRITSARVHVDPPADNTSTTSSTVGWTLARAGFGRRLSADR